MLPFVDIHEETISFQIPWVSRADAESWIIRNEAILQTWEDLPQQAGNIVDVSPTIESIRSNIETVKTYLTLPEKIRNLLYLKEKILY